MTATSITKSLSRREARRLDRRDTILTIARAYFLEHGYAGTTMSGIAAAMGGSKGTLWSYFPSKEALFSAVLDRIVAAYRAELSQILAPCGVPEQILTRACHSLLDKMTSPEAIALHRLIYAEGGRFPELSRMFFQLAPRDARAMLADFILGSMKRGELRQADPLKAATALIALTLSGSHQQLMIGQIAEPLPDQIQADVELAVNLFLRAYAPKPTPLAC
ncbi:TetR/AcrR family transcriptional regulator [Sphingobium sp. MK2]|uniref:TetR/AcrR family transcriptional regulator n=1 Tax=Sphingobium sp. MK2 TaxID=3116540 RepID=UPI0032E36204